MPLEDLAFNLDLGDAIFEAETVVEVACGCTFAEGVERCYPVANGDDFRPEIGVDIAKPAQVFQPL